MEVLRNRYERGLININFLLNANQLLATSTSAYYRASVDYMLALRDFHREKGSLLSYNQVQLAEAGYSAEAYESAYQKGRNYTPRDPGATVQISPGTITQGPFDPSTVGEGLPAPIGSENELAPGTEVPQEQVVAPGTEPSVQNLKRGTTGVWQSQAIKGSASGAMIALKKKRR